MNSRREKIDYIRKAISGQLPGESRFIFIIAQPNGKERWILNPRGIPDSQFIPSLWQDPNLAPLLATGRVFTMGTGWDRIDITEKFKQ